VAKACGKHTILCDNQGARVSRCPCGSVHLLVKSSGVTVQLSEERFHEVGLAVMGAVSALGVQTPRGVLLPQGDPTIN